MKIVIICILGCLFINSINAGAGSFLTQFSAVVRLAEQLHKLNNPRVPTNVPTEKHCTMSTWLLILVVPDNENLCESMSKYKETNLKLANEGDVDVIYSSKESTILKMAECNQDNELGATSQVCQKVLKDGILQKLNSQPPEILFLRKSVFGILKSKLGKEIETGFENSSEMLIVRYRCQDVSVGNMISFYNDKKTFIKTSWVWKGGFIDQLGLNDIHYIKC